MGSPEEDLNFEEKLDQDDRNIEKREKAGVIEIQKINDPPEQEAYNAFLNDESQLPVEVFPGVVWTPMKDEICQFDACYNQAINICNLSIYWGMFFQGCGRNFCTDHTLILKRKNRKGVT